MIWSSINILKVKKVAADMIEKGLVSSEYHKNVLMAFISDESQQPIPQDINKFIEDAPEAPIEYDNNEASCWQIGWSKGADDCAQLLLPELQELREEVKNLKNMMEFIEKDRRAIREKLETTELIAKGNQNSYDAAKGKNELLKKQLQECKEQLAKAKAEKEFRRQRDIFIGEIESLKQENERLKTEHFTDKHLAIIKTKQKAGLQWLEEAKNADYWKQKFESSGKWGDEDMIAFLKFAIAKKGEWFNHDKPEEIFTNWQTLKQQTHG